MGNITLTQRKERIHHRYRAVAGRKSRLDLTNNQRDNQSLFWRGQNGQKNSYDPTYIISYVICTSEPWFTRRLPAVVKWKWKEIKEQINLTDLAEKRRKHFLDSLRHGLVAVRALRFGLVVVRALRLGFLPVRALHLGLEPVHALQYCHDPVQVLYPHCR